MPSFANRLAVLPRQNVDIRERVEYNYIFGILVESTILAAIVRPRLWFFELRQLLPQSRVLVFDN